MTRPESTENQSFRCSYCGKPFQNVDAKHRPFCSRRCQQMDLRNWLTESYGLPIEGEHELAGFEDESESE